MRHDGLLDALLPARADEATAEELERAAALCHERANEVRSTWRFSRAHRLTRLGVQARQALYAVVSVQYGGATGLCDVAAADAALAAADDALGALAQQHGDAAASVAQLRVTLEAALASAQLAKAVEQGEALLRSGLLGAAAACVAAADAAAQAMRAAGDAGPLLSAHESLRATLREGLDDALRKRVAFELHADGGVVHVSTGAEPPTTLWGGAMALGSAALAAQELAGAAAPSVHAAVFCHSGAQARHEAVADGEALTWCDVAEGDVAAPLLAFLGEAALGADACVRRAFGDALCAAVGSAAVTRVLAVDGGASSARWDAELERAAAFELAAAEIGMLAKAAQPLSSALTAALADVRAAAQGEQLALARALALDTSHAAMLVSGAWSGRAADMVGEQQQAPPPGVVCFPTCRVSGAALALAGLLEERLRAGAHGDAADAADMLRACVPCIRLDELMAAPGPAMLFRNSAHFLAFVLRNGAAAARVPALQGAAAALCSAGDAWLAAVVSGAGVEAASALDLADGFGKAGEADRGAAVERALAGALHSVRRFHTLACETLPAAVAASVAQAVLHAVGARAADEILALPDIGVDDCTALASAFDAARARCDLELPLDDAPGWRRLARVRALLDAPLAAIVAGAERGEMRGVLTGRELGVFISAVFCESTLRADALARVAATADD